MRVLIVEDDPSLATALTLVIEQAGHHVVACADVGSGRRVLSDHDMDVVLVDAGVRGGGRAFWEELEASEHHRGRVALLSGDPASIQGAGDPSRVFAKPFAYSRLLAFLDQVELSAPRRAAPPQPTHPSPLKRTAPES